MANAQVDFYGDDRVRFLVESEAQRWLRHAVISLQSDATRSIANKGRLIRKTKTGREVRAPSQPGQPPHRVTGRLASSVGHLIEPDGLAGIVGTNVVYGRYLELGTHKMAARPWLRPAVDRLKMRAEELFRRVL